MSDKSSSGDLLVGADAIHAFLVWLGMPTNTDVYYLKRSGWPIGRTGGNSRGGKLMASKQVLIDHTDKLSKGRYPDE